ncbi:MAG: hypothetical protein UU85_C0001G0107 [Candidatus Wolfebacteria bacterium GW2011_GWA2_42_10]|uniref:Uncharacterized protein n=1 Tax=Candidatus Wolfebacteria bacterium GW2011_GWA2_42_10 TaxID=1619004 RepID=A0A0G0XMI5_9BACT|nr:MAG: hypothetical protein UU85_C0001G0107 [Candidatus Wolfebacteria bacterium GW2011_GWA2_42_10]
MLIRILLSKMSKSFFTAKINFFYGDKKTLRKIISQRACNYKR